VSFPTVDGRLPADDRLRHDPSQVIAGSAGTCAYTRAGNYTLTGRTSWTQPRHRRDPHEPPGRQRARSAGVGHRPPGGRGERRPSQPQTSRAACPWRPTGPRPSIRCRWPCLHPEIPGPPGRWASSIPLDPATAQLSVKPVVHGGRPDGLVDRPADVDAQPGRTTPIHRDGGLSTFVTSQATPSTWRQRFLLTGERSPAAPPGRALSDGPKGNGSTVAYTVTRIDPIYPYAPQATSTR